MSSKGFMEERMIDPSFRMDANRVRGVFDQPPPFLLAFFQRLLDFSLSDSEGENGGQPFKDFLIAFRVIL